MEEFCQNKINFSLDFFLVLLSMPAAASLRSSRKHSRSISTFIRWNRLVNLQLDSVRAFAAMRCNFVATISLFLSIDDVSSQHCYSCDVLSSSGITRLHRYYDAIRLPLPRLPFSLYYQLSGILALKQENRGPPGLPHIRNVRHATVSDPGEAPLTCHSPADMLTSVLDTTSSLSTNPFEAQSLQPYGLQPIVSLSYA